ncbi:hypothetical protein Tco_0014359 [Tanacetum coccineum]
MVNSRGLLHDGRDKFVISRHSLAHLAKECHVDLSNPWEIELDPTAHDDSPMIGEMNDSLNSAAGGNFLDKMPRECLRIIESKSKVLPPEEEDSIFIEIPKQKAKKTVNVEIQEPYSPKPTSYQPKLPYPERMKVRENDKPSAQHSRFLKMFKQLRLEIGLKDALVEMPKFNKWLSVPEKLEDPRKFLIPSALQELDRTSALADSGASINLLSHSIYKKLTLRVGSDELVFYAEKSEKSKNKQFAHAISVIDFSKDEPFSGSTTTHSDALPPSSSPVKTSDNLEEFADELTLLKKDVHFQVYSNPLFEFDDNFTSSNVNPLFNEMDEDVENKNSNVLDFDEPVLLNTPLSDKVLKMMSPKYEDNEFTLPIDLQDNTITSPVHPPDGQYLRFCHLDFSSHLFHLPEDSTVILSFRREDPHFDHGPISSFLFSIKPVPFALPYGNECRTRVSYATR